PSTPQSRGRGRGGGLGSNNSPQSINDYRAKRNRGRGRGRDGYDNPRNDRGSNNSDAPLSLSLRPLLRPVVFVPATQNRFLFQAEEELIQPIVEDAGDEEQSHLPTADRVARLFSGTYQHPEVDDSNDTEGLEEIDFSDVGRFQQVMDGFASGAAAAVGKGDVEEIVEMEEGSTMPTDVFEEAELPLQEETASSVKESLDTVTTEPDGSNQFPRNVEMLASTSLSISTGDADPELAQVSSSIQSIAIQDEARPRKDEDMQSQEPTQQENPTFFVDVSPSSSNPIQTPIITNRVDGLGLGASSISDDDGDIVVYVAPHPRQGRSTAPTPTPGFRPEIRTTSILTGLPIGTAPPAVGPAPTLDSITFTSFGSGVESQSEDNTQSPKVDSTGLLGVLASAQARVQTRSGDELSPEVGEGKDEGGNGEGIGEAEGSQRAGRTKEEEVGGAEQSEGLWHPIGASLGAAEGMEIDPELDIDMETMKRFVEGMGPSGSRHVTMDDLEDERRIREEDEEKRNEGDEESEEDDDDEEEERNPSTDHEDVEDEDVEDEDVEDDDDDDGEDEDNDDDDDQSPRSSFQARLEHLRKRALSQTSATSAKSKGKSKAKTTLDDDSGSDDEDDWDRNRTWAEEDDDFIAHEQDILDENEDNLVGQDKKSKKQVFQAVYNGDFEDVDTGKPARKAKDKHKDIPPDLVDRWNKDRAKKAIRKKERELARLAAAADPLTKKQGGKKGRKAMLAAAKLDPTIVVLPNRVIDMSTLVQQIRRFIDNIGGPSSMSLPPANKQTRKDIHELAAAFNLKSLSKGDGDARYTTLTKTTMSGIRVNQKVVAKIVRRRGGLADNAEFVGGADISKKHAERGKAGKSMPKHREGDEVGKAAPKINETNIGFKMLASMGWAEGDSIGRSGGLQNPLTAVIKNTKLGLGAMK
ncbi:hypothetical protein GG344DRAFT_50130, partial [Lentinula edodes]